MSYLDMAHDGGYRGQEAREVAQILEYEEMMRAYGREELDQLQELADDLRSAVDEDVPF